MYLRTDLYYGNCRVQALIAFHSDVRLFIPGDKSLLSLPLSVVPLLLVVIIIFEAAVFSRRLGPVVAVVVAAVVVVVMALSGSGP